MFNSDVGLFFSVGAFFVGTFIILQVVTWRRGTLVIGGSRGFAQLAFAIGLTSLGVVTLVLLAPTLDLGVLRGAPFVLLFTLALLSSFVVPALVTIESILVAESLLTTRIDRGARPWHLAALLTCASWVGVVVIKSAV
jgi:hypothetical protein